MLLAIITITTEVLYSREMLKLFVERTHSKENCSTVCSPYAKLIENNAYHLSNSATITSPISIPVLRMH